MSAHQKKRTTDMLSNLLKDISEIGLAIGSEAELNVSNYITLSFNFFLNQ